MPRDPADKTRINGQLLSERFTLFEPQWVKVIKDLGHCTPTNIFDEHRLFFIRGGSRFGFQRPKLANGFEVLLKLLLRAALAQSVGLGNAVTVEVLRRLVALPLYSSGGSRMYFSLTISQAWSCACCAVDPCCIN